MTLIVTRTAVSVVICNGPSLLPVKPRFRSSDVLSVVHQFPFGLIVDFAFLTPRRIIP